MPPFFEPPTKEPFYISYSLEKKMLLAFSFFFSFFVRTIGEKGTILCVRKRGVRRGVEATRRKREEETRKIDRKSILAARKEKGEKKGGSN